MSVVLLVEDHPDTRLMYAEFLRDKFEVVQAGGGEEALALMTTRVPDLVITDLTLPGVDGFELVILMRRNARTATIPVICLTGHSGPSHEQRAREAGCDRLIQKPCLPDALAAAAADLLGKRSGERETP